MDLIKTLQKKYQANRKVKVVAEKSLQELAKDALEVQNASNLLGVSKSFAKAVQEVWEACGRKDMDELRRHPIVILWMDKMNDMVGRPEMSEFSKAYDEVEKLVKS